MEIGVLIMQSMVALGRKWLLSKCTNWALDHGRVSLDMARCCSPTSSSLAAGEAVGDGREECDDSVDLEKTKLAFD